MRATALLLGALAIAACSSPTDDAKDPQRCATCHMDDFRSVSQPVHVGTRPPTCAICHTETAWQPATVHHPWPLTGAHAKASCFACHKGDPETFAKTAKDCVSCHRKEYERAPSHVAKKFSTKCESCHQTDEWTDRLGGPSP
jgi:hypothetical protein